MAIEKLISAPNGAPVAYHQVFKLMVDFPVFGDAAPRTLVLVNSWKDYDSHGNKDPIQWQWALEDVLDAAQFMEPEESLIDNVKSPFDGGLVVDFSTPTVESAGLRKLVEIAKIYNEKNDAVLPTPFGAIDGDDKSKTKVTQTVTFWQLLERLNEAPATIDFTLANNTQVAVTPEQLDVMGALLGAREQSLRGIRNALRLAVAQAGSVEEVQAVVWPEPAVPAPAPMPAP
jgi:hypothetical protein